MTNLSHDAAQELLAPAALGALDPGDLRELLDHLQSCSRCVDRLVEYHAAAAAFALSLSEQPMEAGRANRLRARLIARAHADVDPAGVPAVQPAAAGTPRRNSRERGRWVGWAVAAGMSSLLLAHHSFHRPLDLGWLAAAALGLLLVCTGVYATVLRNRVSDLQQRGRGGGNVQTFGSTAPS